MNKIKFIMIKEFHHILRDPKSLMIVFIMPIMMTFLYGYAINMDINNVKLEIVDYDHTQESHNLIEDFYSSTYFSRPDKEILLNDPEDILRSGAASAILVIKPGFGKALKNGEKFSLGMLVDGSDNTLSAAVMNFANGVLANFFIDRLPPGFEIPGITISRQVLYNPDLKSSHFLVPGLVAIILIMISALLTSITIAREKETGTMEQLLTAPVKPREILLGKIFPYVIIAFLDGVLVLLFAKYIFGVPFVGSHWLLLFFGLIYITTALSIGILISSLVSTQQLAMMFTLMATMLPSVLLSGFIFPLKNMPYVLQGISYIVPARYFLIIIRSIMLKGAGFMTLIPQALALIGLMVLFIFVATKKFKTRVG